MAVDGSTPIAPGRAATGVTSAIAGAAQATGTSFNYLLATAKIESDFDPAMTVRSSSATGLFQFIEQTWLGTLKQAGPAFGLGACAAAITRNAAGQYIVADPRMRREIMALRTDPSASAMMAGALTQQNAAALSRRIGRQPTESELYIAHFFGAGGAGKLINLAGSSPQLVAAGVFPQAAQANRAIFYDRQGNPRSVAGVYGELVHRYRLASNSLGAGYATAGTSPRPRGPASPAAAPAAPDLVAAAIVPASIGASSAVPQTASPFNSLFRDPQRSSAIAPVVAELWSVPGSEPQSAPAASPPAAKPQDASIKYRAPADSGLFDLFLETRPDARPLFDASS
jgi:hypothetical protein